MLVIEAFKLWIPGEPISGSQLKFNRRTGFAYRPNEHKQRVFTIHEYAEHEIAKKFDGKSPVFENGIALSLGVTFKFPYRSADYGTGRNAGKLKKSAPTYVVGRKDLDNLLKPLKDGMQGLVYANDNQLVQYRHVDKRYSESPGTYVEVVPMEVLTNEA